LASSVFALPFLPVRFFVINPLRSEQEAFRFFVYVLVVVAVAVGIVFFVRAIT
jgi:hypothetical protein